MKRYVIVDGIKEIQKILGFIEKEEHTTAEISVGVDTPIASVYRVMRDLVVHGWVIVTYTFNSESRRYVKKYKSNISIEIKILNSSVNQMVIHPKSRGYNLNRIFRLLINNQMTAREVGKIVGLGSNGVYRYLNELEKGCWIEHFNINGQVARLYKAIAPESYIWDFEKEEVK